MKNILLKVIDNSQRPKGYKLILSALGIIFLQLIIGLIIYLTGGTKFVYLHLMYIPVILSAFLFRISGGVIAAIIGGILLGPLMPLDVENNISQPIMAYFYRTALFILVGALVGYLSNLLRERMKLINKTIDKMSQLYGRTLRNYATMVSIRDEQTAFHCERVAYNAYLLGHSIGLDDKSLKSLYWAGLLHDLGKIGVKEEILLKPGKLTEEEFDDMKYHTKIGYHLIKSVAPEMDNIASGIRSHHEKWDGSGYPDGLQGEAIPLFGRMLAIVDVFEALTSARPYKDSWESDEAIKFIEENQGIAFDRILVCYFIQLYREDKIWISKGKLPEKMIEIPNNFDEELILTQ